MTFLNKKKGILLFMRRIISNRCDLLITIF